MMHRFFRRLQAIETERLPQVLAIQHSDEEEEEDENGDEGFSGMRNDSSDEEHEVEKHGNSIEYSLNETTLFKNVMTV